MHFLGVPHKKVEEMAEKKDVKGLIHALTDKDWFVRVRAASALGEIGDSRAVKALVLALKDENQLVRKDAAKALGKMRDTTALRSLAQALTDEHRNTRSDAAEALDKLGWVPGNDVEKAQYLVAKEAWSEVVKLGQVAAEPLAHAMKTGSNGDVNVHTNAAQALARIGDARGIEFLIEALKDKDWNARGWAAGALGEVGDARAVEPLTHAQSDLAGNVQNSAKLALEKIAGTYSPWPPQPPRTKFEKDVINYAEHYCKNAGLGIHVKLGIVPRVGFSPHSKETEVSFFSQWDGTTMIVPASFSIWVSDTIVPGPGTGASDVYKEFLKYMDTHPIPDQCLEPKLISDTIELARQKNMSIDFYLDFRKPLPDRPGFAAHFELVGGSPSVWVDMGFRGEEIVIRKCDGWMDEDFEKLFYPLYLKSLFRNS